MVDTTPRQTLLLRAAAAVREHAESGCGSDPDTLHKAVKEALDAGIDMDEIAEANRRQH